MTIADCLFPFAHPGSVLLWLGVAVAAGVVWGQRAAAKVGDDPAAYRERWGRAPRTSLIAVSGFLGLSVVVLVAAAVWPGAFCDDVPWGWLLLVQAPWSVAGLAFAVAPMARLARMDRDQAA